MEKEIMEFVAVISTVGILTACSETSAIEAKKDDTSVSAQNIRPFVDHDGLARRYENRARKLLEIAAEHEKRLQNYEDKSYLYGRHGQDSQADAIALVQKYKLENSKDENTKPNNVLELVLIGLLAGLMGLGLE